MSENMIDASVFSASVSNGLFLRPPSKPKFDAAFSLSDDKCVPETKPYHTGKGRLYLPRFKGAGQQTVERFPLQTCLAQLAGHSVCREHALRKFRIRC